METIFFIFLGLTIGIIMLLLVINLVIEDLIIGFVSKGFTKINDFLMDILCILFVPTVLLGIMTVIVNDLM